MAVTETTEVVITWLAFWRVLVFASEVFVPLLFSLALPSKAFAAVCSSSCLWRIDTVASFPCNVTLLHSGLLGPPRDSIFLDVADFKSVRAG
jgi:hypothetical protein